MEAVSEAPTNHDCSHSINEVNLRSLLDHITTSINCHSNVTAPCTSAIEQNRGSIIQWVRWIFIQ